MRYRDEIRKQTGLIVEKDGEFIIGNGGGFVRWGSSPYDAWKTRDREQARMVAERVGGTLMLFNPVLRQVKKYEEGDNEKGTERHCQSKTQDNGSSQ